MPFYEFFIIFFIILPGQIPNKPKPGESARKLVFTTNPEKGGRRPACDIIIGKEGPVNGAENIRTPRDGFEYYFTRKLMIQILEFTNKKMAYTLQNLKNSRGT